VPAPAPAPAPPYEEEEAEDEAIHAGLLSMPGRAAKEGERERGAASAGGMGGARSPHVCGGRDIAVRPRRQALQERAVENAACGALSPTPCCASAEDREE
jgi:hypothetical protein